MDYNIDAAQMWVENNGMEWNDHEGPVGYSTYSRKYPPTNLESFHPLQWVCLQVQNLWPMFRSTCSVVGINLHQVWIQVWSQIPRVILSLHLEMGLSGYGKQRHWFHFLIFFINDSWLQSSKNVCTDCIVSWNSSISQADVALAWRVLDLLLDNMIFCQIAMLYFLMIIFFQNNCFVLTLNSAMSEWVWDNCSCTEEDCLGLGRKRKRLTCLIQHPSTWHTAW